MNKISLVGFFILSLVFMSCDKNETGDKDLNINFKLVYGGAPLVLLQDYAYPDGRALLFNRVSFYVSGVQLNSSSGTSTSSDVKMVNFNASNSSLAGALAGNIVKFNGFTEGNISKLKLCFGVDKTNNSKEPSNFKSGESLSDQSEYWAGWKSYIFMRLEGFLDAKRDGKKNLGFALHTGSDDAYTCLEFPVNFKIEGNSVNTVNVLIDIKKVFGTSTTYNIDANPQIHSLSQLAQALELAGNLKTAVSVE